MCAFQFSNSIFENLGLGLGLHWQRCEIFITMLLVIVKIETFYCLIIGHWLKKLWPIFIIELCGYYK